MSISVTITLHFLSMVFIWNCLIRIAKIIGSMQQLGSSLGIIDRNYVKKTFYLQCTVGREINILVLRIMSTSQWKLSMLISMESYEHISYSPVEISGTFEWIASFVCKKNHAYSLVESAVMSQPVYEDHKEFSRQLTNRVDVLSGLPSEY